MPATAEVRREIVRAYRVRNPERAREIDRRSKQRQRKRQAEAATMVPAAPLLDVIADASLRLGGIIDLDNNGANQQREVGGKRRFAEAYAERIGVDVKNVWVRLRKITKAADEGGTVPRTLADEVCIAARVHPVIVFGAEWHAGRVDARLAPWERDL